MEASDTKSAETAKQSWRIYNLSFPDYIKTFDVGNYTFKRVPNYKDAFLGMQHKVDISGTEFHAKLNTGSHQITAIAETNKPEIPAVLPWGKAESQLADILFLMTLFEGRHVFVHEAALDNGGIIVADHRMFEHGRDLRMSMDFEQVHEHDERGMCTGSYWVGFAKTFNQVLALIATEEWQKKYKGGHFLFIYRWSLQRQIIESSFILSWTVWSHIYTVLNPKNLSEDDLRNVPERDKIAFILETFFNTKVGANDLKRLVRARNRVVHFGMKPDDFDTEEMRIFVDATDVVIAKILDRKATGGFTTPAGIAKLLQ